MAGSVKSGAASAGKVQKNTGKIAVVYFSKTGDAKSVALAIAKNTGADIFEVQTVEPYPKSYGPTTEIVKKEMNEGIHRAIKAPDIDLSKYSVIILGSPTWWYHIADPLQTWIKSVDLSDKLVLTYNTHGGGGLMHTREDFEKLLPNCKLGKHFTQYGSVSPTSKEVRAWLDVALKG